MTETIRRREFLKLSSMAAVSTVLAACGAAGTQSKRNASTSSSGGGTSKPASSASTAQGSISTQSSSSTGVSTGATTSASGQSTGSSTHRVDIGRATPATYSGAYKESPALADMVRAGKLPPVKDRLPDNPYVVPHDWLTEGKYGGSMQWVCTDSSDWQTTHSFVESQYGHSPLRWLGDGLQLGPGLAESWESNPDQTVWTYHFRKGLKWSDGEPWTVDDVLFWWEDEALNEQLNPTGATPLELKSGKGNPVTMKKVDDYTLELRYDSPTPLSADFAATWVKRGIGPQWMDPKHYLKQFHIKYNPKLDKKKWVSDFQAKLDWATNPDNPTMTGWKPKQYKQGQFSVWERNPYYYCIDKWGNQLPYMDGLRMNNIQDPQAMRLQIQTGKADFVFSDFNGITLGDVGTIKQSKSRNHLDLQLWDSGSGTGSIFFFNYDYIKDSYRKLFRNPKFRQALSIAFNREAARKAIYFNQGEATTGTMSPKSVEYQIGQGVQVYKQWRDSWKNYDPERAKKMLDDLGVKDVDGDGWRETPEGDKLRITLDYGTPGSPEHIQKDELLAGDWQKIGINAKANPVSGTGLSDKWANGTLMSTTAWEASDGPNSLINPTWLVPSEPSRWAPLEGQYWILRKTKVVKQQTDVSPWKRNPPRMAPEKDGPVERLWKLLDKANLETDFMKRNQLVWQIMKIHIQEGPFFQGTVANYPQIVMYHEDMRNIPRREQLPLNGYVNTWALPCPADYDPETFYWVNPESHS